MRHGMRAVGPSESLRITVHTYGRYGEEEAVARARLNMEPTKSS